MPEKTLTRAKGKLRIAAGVAEPIEIDADVATEQSGRSVHEALTHIIDRHVRDPELRELLNAPRLVLDLYSHDDQGEDQESRLTLEEKWDTVLEPMAKGKVVEVGMAERHRGGSSGRGGGRTS